MRRITWLLIPVLSACLTYVPPAAPQPRAGSPVAASFDRTWNSVIDQFAEQVITIETMERASGFIVASRASISTRSKADSAFGASVADCGGFKQALGGVASPAVPTSAKYNVLVRAIDAEHSMVQVTARFLSSGAPGTVECSSRGAFERDFEARVKARAERAAP